VTTIALTSGEPAGIGPELCAMVAGESWDAELVILGDRGLIESRGRARGLDVSRLAIEHIALNVPSRPGTLDPANAAYVLALLDRALEGCRDGRFDAMVTAPLHKGAINEAKLPGPTFTGHTEYLAMKTATPKVVMMLTGAGLRVALATTHLALKDVSSAITQESLRQTIEILHADLIAKFGIAAPRILIAGLNPHAGEGGYLGREEIDTIAPVVAEMRARGMNLTGPLPADTLFTRQHLDHADAVLAMYHDQGLIPLKQASFGQAVNVTLGLPLIRTSVDHGTALDKAGGGDIDAGSMRAAIRLAIELAERRTVHAA
jgi:4-hydroxythreonine-4-phosphate dehydrogenase